MSLVVGTHPGRVRAQLASSATEVEAVACSIFLMFEVSCGACSVVAGFSRPRELVAKNGEPHNAPCLAFRPFASIWYLVAAGRSIDRGAWAAQLC